MAITERSRCTAAVTIFLQCCLRQHNAANTSNSKNHTRAVQALQMSARCWWAHRGTCRRGSDLDKKQKASAIVLQAWYRAVQTCTEYGKRYRTILFLQGHMGCHMAHQRYLLQLRSVAVMQRLFRRVPAQNSDCSLQGVFSNVGACTIVISCVYSSLLARSRLS